MPPYSEDQRREIGARIRKVRMSANNGKGMSLEEMAECLGVSFSHLSKAEAGINAFSPRFVESVAREFATSMDWLLTGEGQMMTCELKQEKDGYVVRMVDRVSPARIAEMILDPTLIEQAKGVSKILNINLQKATEMVVTQRLADQLVKT
jgi:transcriptional regulator with XRE-family HTH domain